jgi:cytochrome c
MKTLLSLTATVLFGICASAAAAGDPEKGAKVFKKCKACHAVGDGAKNKVGPQLNNIVGNAAGTVEDYKYSKALAAQADGGLIWDEAALLEFLKKPKAYMPGTKMSFSGLKKESDRENLISYLATFTDTDTLAAAPVEEREVALSEATLSIDGDVAYGEYLASDCQTCHQVSGASDGGVPSIVGWPRVEFVYAMHAYKQKVRSNPVMQMMAGGLGDEEIAALAAYFEGLE